MYGMSDDNMSCFTAQHRTGYGIDEPYNRHEKKPGTGMSNVTRMTKMPQKNAVTKVAAQHNITEFCKNPTKKDYIKPEAMVIAFIKFDLPAQLFFNNQRYFIAFYCAVENLIHVYFFI